MYASLAHLGQVVDCDGGFGMVLAVLGFREDQRSSEQLLRFAQCPALLRQIREEEEGG
jgi:hypothetical protein